MDLLTTNVFQSEVATDYRTDKDGCKMRMNRLVDVDYLFSEFPNLVSLKHFPDIRAYPDDIIVCGYPKCGTHWVWEIVNMLVSKSTEYVRDIKECYMFEAISNSEVLNTLKRPRVFNSHFPPKLLPPDFLAQQSRLIYITRQPKDVAVSLYNHVTKITLYGYKGNWNAFLDLFLDGDVEYGKFATYEKEWKTFVKHNKVHVIQYEGLKTNPMAKIKELAEFLQVDIDDVLLKGIVEQTDFAKMKVSKAKFDSEKEKDNWVNREPMMYRKG